MPNGQLNFEKFWQLAKQITDFLTWKQVEVRGLHAILRYLYEPDELE